MKILKVLISVISVVVILYLLYTTFIFGWLGERKHLIDIYIDTQFAPDYSPAKFDKIKTGMTLNEVEAIIGKPFYTHIPYVFYDVESDSLYYVENVSNEIEYVYTGDGKLLNKMQKQGKRYYYDCAWYRSSILVDTNNIVVGINKGWSYD